MPNFETMEDLLTNLGGIAPGRVRLDPAPGTATVADVLRLYEKHKRLFELVDGTLVEKAMGVKESFIAATLIQLLTNFSDAHGRLGMTLGEAGTLKLFKGLVRIPDVSFTRWERLPGGKVPNDPIPDLVPDLAVEVLSKANTRREMERKLKEYFLSGVKLVWFVEPVARIVRAFTSPDDVIELGINDILEGGDVLPGFAVPVSRLFVDLSDTPSPQPKIKDKKPRR
ncbi:MAG TPA: Uma2 family endonuclease [Gemmata sp.]|jgi:Uma2 family endonuclease|nr:Uma2 family endonuclease [Gemmata sp.]